MTAVPTEVGTCELCGGLECAEPVTSGWDFEYGTTRQEFPIVRCRQYGQLFLSERPAPAAMHIVYPNNYYAFSESGGELPLVYAVRTQMEKAKVSGLLSALSGTAASAIDIGCGDGRLLAILKEHGPAGWQLHGVEISPVAAERARQNGFSVTQSDFESMGAALAGKRFDLALMHQVIEHLRSPRQALRAVRGLLNKGGILSIETPDVDGWDAKLFRQRHWGGYHLPRHFHLFNRKALSALLTQEGFEIVRTKPLPSPVFWIFSLRNRLVDRGVAFDRVRWMHYQNVPLLAVATTLDIVQILLVRQTSNQQIWARAH